MAQKEKQHNKLKAIPAETGKTNLWLASELQMNRTTVSKCCTSNILPTIENLFKMAGCLDIDFRNL